LARSEALHLHLGLTVFSVFPAAVVFFLTGSWIAAAALTAFLNLLGLTGGYIPVAISFHVLKPMYSLLKRNSFTPERMVIHYLSLNSLKKINGGKGIPPEKLLLLLPHCLQNHTCTYRITFDASNCRRCGKCPVGEIMALAEEKGTPVAVATGGTLARRHIKDRKPLAVVAVACPRDLGQGMLDAWPVPVIGVENTRPCGDCLDTQVDVSSLKKAIEDLTS